MRVGANRVPAPVLPLSARSPAALRALAGRYATLLDERVRSLSRDVCWTAATRRTPLEHRAVVRRRRSRLTLANALRRFAAGEARGRRGRRASRTGRAAKSRSCVPGQGAQWVGMARELAAASRCSAPRCERCERGRAARSSTGRSSSSCTPQPGTARLPARSRSTSSSRCSSRWRSPTRELLAVARRRAGRASSATAWARSPPRTSPACSTSIRRCASSAGAAR